MGVLLAVAGVAVFVVLQISTTDPDFRMVLPGSQAIELEKGDYTLFYEHRTLINERTYATDPTVPAIRFFVMAPDESGVHLDTPNVNETYDFDGRAGYSVITFSIESAGSYTVGGGFPGESLGAIFIFALGKSTSGPFIVAVLSVIGGLGGGIVLLVATYLMRRPVRPQSDPDGIT